MFSIGKNFTRWNMAHQLTNSMFSHMLHNKPKQTPSVHLKTSRRAKPKGGSRVENFDPIAVAWGFFIPLPHVRLQMLVGCPVKGCRKGCQLWLPGDNGSKNSVRMMPQWCCHVICLHQSSYLINDELHLCVHLSRVRLCNSRSEIPGHSSF